MNALFHLAYNVINIDEARHFYGSILKCTEGRRTQTWVDYDFYGHQLSLHIGKPFQTENTGKVGDHIVPMPHMGIILPLDEWHALANRLIDANIPFEIEPFVRFQGESSEQYIMFFRDPSGNPIEAKSFKNFDGIFSK